jgi:hypothetical protein
VSRVKVGKAAAATAKNPWLPEIRGFQKNVVVSSRSDLEAVTNACLPYLVVKAMVT